MTNCRAKFHRAILRLALRYEYSLAASLDWPLPRRTGGFLILQGLAAWRGLEAAKSLAYRAGRVQQARLVQFRQAVERSGSIAELQGQLAAIQAPPLSAADQR